MKQLTYEDAAQVLGYSPRHVRRILKKNGISPIRRGHRTIRLPADKIGRLAVKLGIKKLRRIKLNTSLRQSESAE
jgi:excisionase family DNA binding protein